MCNLLVQNQNNDAYSSLFSRYFVHDISLTLSLCRNTLKLLARTVPSAFDGIGSVRILFEVILLVKEISPRHQNLIKRYVHVALLPARRCSKPGICDYIWTYFFVEMQLYLDLTPQKLYLIPNMTISHSTYVLLSHSCAIKSSLPFVIRPTTLELGINLEVRKSYFLGNRQTLF